ncbi:IS30 family transposase [Undibacterium sp. 5I1]|uniref:IS30 family transposase n=3 Tax=unclassified Undibacterium TaxID=2630295 RepID=UPI002AB5AEAB|nr:IS30 family transposase [Undibacterium sp. 5I1]MDY7538068.1 IS30 family transposase [Undibacterium sp. 5I1]
MRYTHLTQDERYQIYALRLEKKTVSEIAAALHRHKSSIHRELKRNTGGSGWRPLQAKKIADERQKNSRNARRIDDNDWLAVSTYLRMDLSPQQAIERLSLERQEKMKSSHETVYLRIYADRRAGGTLFKHLRGQKPYRKRYGSGQQRRGMLKNRISIDQRPAIVDQKICLGDWEGDTIIGKKQQGIVITRVDRVSRFTLARQHHSKHAQGVAASIEQLLTPHQQHCHTITFDNGREFAGHESIAAHLQAQVYFAHPYHSWERGLNENTNGLLRYYFPKNTNFKEITQAQLQRAVNQLNHRPRKCLGYRTPFEVFYNLDILPLKLTSRCSS